MGLDMYLEKEYYVGGDGINVDVGGGKIINAKKLIEDIGYWRKANYIHHWFIENCADGIDDCKRIYVSEENISELYETVCKVLKSKETELLPPCTGFFFGSDEIDEYYWEGLEHTKDVLENVIKGIEKNEKEKIYPSIYYQASW